MDEELAPTLQNILDQVCFSGVYLTDCRNHSNGYSAEAKEVSEKRLHRVPLPFSSPKYANQSSSSVLIQVFGLNSDNPDVSAQSLRCIRSEIWKRRPQSTRVQ